MNCFLVDLARARGLSDSQPQRKNGSGGDRTGPGGLGFVSTPRAPFRGSCQFKGGVWGNGGWRVERVNKKPERVSLDCKWVDGGGGAYSRG